MTARSESKALFEVFVDDNFHYQDESERYRFGEYETYEKAAEICRGIVDRQLLHLYKQGDSAAELYFSYTSFGEDPFIRPAPKEDRFSAWDYARQRCEEICTDGPTTEARLEHEGKENENFYSISYLFYYCGFSRLYLCERGSKHGVYPTIRPSKTARQTGEGGGDLYRFRRRARSQTKAGD